MYLCKGKSVKESTHYLGDKIEFDFLIVRSSSEVSIVFDEGLRSKSRILFCRVGNESIFAVCNQLPTLATV